MNYTDSAAYVHTYARSPKTSRLQFFATARAAPLYICTCCSRPGGIDLYITAMVKRYTRLTSQPPRLQLQRSRAFFNCCRKILTRCKKSTCARDFYGRGASRSSRLSRSTHCRKIRDARQPDLALAAPLGNHVALLTRQDYAVASTYELFSLSIDFSCPVEWIFECGIYSRCKYSRLLTVGEMLRPKPFYRLSAFLFWKMRLRAEIYRPMQQPPHMECKQCLQHLNWSNEVRSK